METFNEAGAISSFPSAGGAALHAVIPVCLAIECLRGEDTLHLRCQELLKYFETKNSELLSSQRDERVKGSALGGFLISEMMSALLPKLRRRDMNFRHEWIREWYGQNLDVCSVLEYMGFPSG